MVEWVKDTDWWVEGGEEAEVYRTFYKGVYITVYPLKLIRKGALGWEYELYRAEPVIDWDSLTETSNCRVSTEHLGDHAKTPEQAQNWAIKTVDEWDE